MDKLDSKAAVGVLKRNANHQAAVILSDLEDERKPKGDRSSLRAAFRVVFLAGMIGVLVGLLVYYIEDSPDVKVKQIQHLGVDESNYDIPMKRFYNRENISADGTSYYGGRLGVRFNTQRANFSLSCPCTTTTIQWRKFARFYALVVNSSDWSFSRHPPNECPPAGFYGSPSPCTLAPSLNVSNTNLLKDNIVRLRNGSALDGTEGHTEFCDKATLFNVTGDQVMEFGQIPECYWLAGILFPDTGNYITHANDSDFINTDTLETPMLLDRETFFARVAGIAREAIVRRYPQFQNANPSEHYGEYYTNIGEYLLELLDRGELEEEWQSVYEGAYYYAKNSLGTTWYVSQNSTDNSTSQLIYMHTVVDWKEYYNACAPAYCDLTTQLKTYQRVLWACVAVGGLSTFVLAITTKILWPAAALLVNFLTSR